MKAFNSYRHIHLTGIQGIGMTALALILADMGVKVTGSDTPETFMTEQFLRKRNITVYKEFSAQHIGQTELVIYTGAVGAGNIEVRTADQKGIPTMPLADALGELSKLKQTISVCGCHGKTTTTALVAHIGQELTGAMSWYVGAPGFMQYPPGKWQQDDYFALESDEYVIDPFTNKSAKFLTLSPKHIICANIDFDHPDVYETIQSVEAAYTAFFDKLPSEGYLVVNGDDARALFVARASGKEFYTFGFGTENDFMIENVQFNQLGALFELSHHGRVLGEFTTQLSGRHNVLNAVSAISLFSLLGRDTKHVARALSTFSGAKRRMELCGKAGESYVYDDYAHHPAEIKASVEGLRAKYPHHKIVIIFHPHTYTRTASLKSDFVEALSLADYAGVLPIFASAREREKQIPIRSEDLVSQAHSAGNTYMRLLPDGQAVKRLVQDVCHARETAVYITMGAGDVYTYIPLILETLKSAL